MRIALVNDYGLLLGGAERYCFALEECLRKAGHEVLLVTSKHVRKEISPKADVLLSESGCFKNLDSIWNPRSYWEFRQALCRFNPDVIHFQNVFYALSPSVIDAAKGFTRVLTLHDYFAICYADKRTISGEVCRDALTACRSCSRARKTSPVDRWRRLQARRVLQKIELLIAPSTFVAQAYTANGLGAPYTLSHPCMKISAARAASVVVDSTPTRLLIVGRLADQKGIAVALQALAYLKDTNAEVSLDIAGEGPQRSELERLCSELGVSSRVRFHGWCSEDTLARLYSEATLFLQPSLWPEVAGLSVMEAAAFGLPTIASAVGGLSDTIEDGTSGYLLPPGDAKVLAAKVEEVVGNVDAYRRMRERVKERAEEATMEHHVQELLKLYDSPKRYRPV